MPMVEEDVVVAVVLMVDLEETLLEEDCGLVIIWAERLQ